MTPGSGITIEDLVSTASFFDLAPLSPRVQMSPDGKQIVFQRRISLIEENSYVIDLWLVPSSGGEPKQLTHHSPTKEPFTSLCPAWSPDSTRVAFMSPDGAGDRISVVHVDGDVRHLPLEGGTAITAFSEQGLRWSPDGQSIGFLFASEVPDEEPPNHGIEIDLELGPNIASQPPMSPQELVTLDVASQRMRRFHTDGLRITGFDWSPDGSQIVLSAGQQLGISYDESLYVLESNGDVRQLLIQPGSDSLPTWSPDGRWIAFASQRGVSKKYQKWPGKIPAVVPIEGGDPTYPTEDFIEEVFRIARVFWAEDSSSLFFECMHRIGRHLFHVPISGGRPTQVTTGEGTWVTNVSFDGGLSRVAFTSESIIDPPKVYTSDLTNFQPKIVAALYAGSETLGGPTVERLVWRSADDKWDVHGLLVLPPDHRGGDRHPLLVELVGGPSMVMNCFGSSVAFPVLALATEGYAVFIPNTRGRAGYGYSFDNALDIERSHGRNPLGDIMSGIAEVVEKGYVDSERMGLMGHSYGGYLTAYTLTQTDQFRAAIFHEGIVDTIAHSNWRTSSGSYHFSDESPFDPEEFRRMQAESPIHNVHRMSTPLLIEAGEKSSLVSDATLLAYALHEKEVPHKLVIYPRTGHVTTEPLLLIDDYRRDIDWFNYWLLDKPYPDPSEQEAFDEWKEINISKSSG